MKRIVYIDGGKLIVCTPVINTYPEPEPITEDEAIARAMAKISETATDVHVLDETAIPASRANRNGWTYNADKTAVIEGAPTVPASVTKRQGMAELIDRNLLTTIQGQLDAIPGKAGDLARNDFANSQEWQRTWPLIAQMAQVNGWSVSYVDEMFISAAAR